MLHQINPPICINQLEQVLAFLRKVLSFVCDFKTTLPVSSKQISHYFGDEIGTWLSEKLELDSKKRSENSLHKAFKGVISHVKANPSVGSVILQVFDHDITFYQHLDDPSFCFKFNRELSKEAQDVVKELSVLFYSNLLNAGFPQAVHLGEDRRLSRKEFLKSFAKANPHLSVCAACDADSSDDTDKDEDDEDDEDSEYFDDTDHFLPKSKYPLLSMHPANLVPICLQCNRIHKGDVDPIFDHDDAPLLSIFHPYEKPAIKFIKISYFQSRNKLYKVRLEDTSGSSSKRLESLDKLFDLQKRWSGSRRRKRVFQTIFAALERKKLDMNQGKPLTEIEVRSGLVAMLKESGNSIGRSSNSVLLKALLDCTLSDKDCFSHIMNYYTEYLQEIYSSSAT